MRQTLKKQQWMHMDKREHVSLYLFVMYSPETKDVYLRGKPAMTPVIGIYGANECN